MGSATNKDMDADTISDKGSNTYQRGIPLPMMIWIQLSTYIQIQILIMIWVQLQIRIRTQIPTMIRVQIPTAEMDSIMNNHMAQINYFLCSRLRVTEMVDENFDEKLEETNCLPEPFHPRSFRAHPSSDCTPHNTAAYRRTRYRYAPSSRNAPRLLVPPSHSRGLGLPWLRWLGRSVLYGACKKREIRAIWGLQTMITRVIWGL